MDDKLNIKTRLTKDVIEKFTKEGFWIDKPLADYLSETAKKCPDKTAVVDRDRRITYRQLLKSVNRMSLGLIELGIRKGDVVSFQLPNWLETVIIILVVEGEKLPRGMRSFEAFMNNEWEKRKNPECLEDLKIDPNAVTLIMFTSGTESDPKGFFTQLIRSTVSAGLPSKHGRLERMIFSSCPAQ